MPENDAIHPGVRLFSGDSVSPVHRCDENDEAVAQEHEYKFGADSGWTQGISRQAGA
ncbi:hypothetical protein [Parvibaculum sp.]|uniref:hypothetical protein n=1 Tax=Parvibaculum sp. TaxID=2024848 RepID=UPI001D58AB05|nr:hypothetical protein [Parvibaculum sp.]MBX3489169.1 hypothetical protein [Parvibaculum sp.]